MNGATGDSGPLFVLRCNPATAQKSPHVNRQTPNQTVQSSRCKHSHPPRKNTSRTWQQRKLEELLIPAKAKNVDGKFTKNDVLSVSGEFGIVNQIALKGKSSAGESVLPYSVVNWGDAVYTKSPLKEAPYGIIKVNQGRAGIVSTLYAVYTLRQHLIVPVFLELYFDSNVRLNNYLKPLVNKGAKNDMKVKNVDVLKGHIHITPNVVEQARIAEFFRVLDDRIAAAKKKADLLKLKKRYYLQAIFNQRLRFKGFTEPWQQRKLGELFKERSERSNQGELISVTITNGVVPASSLERKDNSSEDKSNYKQVKTGDIAYNTMRMWQGASGVSPYSGMLSPAYTVLIPSSEVSSSFFAQMFKLVRMLHLFEYLTCWGPGLLRLGAIMSFGGYCVSRPGLLRLGAVVG